MEIVQVSELYRQGIVVPASEGAARRLDSGFALADGSDAEFFVELPENNVALWMHGFFDAVNRACRAKLSEHEAETIEYGELQRLQKVVMEQIARFDDERKECLQQVLAAIELAERGRVPLVWVL